MYVEMKAYKLLGAFVTLALLIPGLVSVEIFEDRRTADLEKNCKMLREGVGFDL